MKGSALLKVLLLVIALIATVCTPSVASAQRGGHMGGGGFHGGGGYGGFHGGNGFHGGVGYPGGAHGWGGPWHGGYWGYPGYGYGWGWGFGFGVGVGVGLGFGSYWSYPYPYYGYYPDYPYAPYYPYPYYYPSYPAPYYYPNSYSPYGGGAVDERSTMYARAAAPPQGSRDSTSFIAGRSSVLPAPRYTSDRVTGYPFQDPALRQLLPERRRAVQNVISTLRAMPPEASQRQIDSGRLQSFSPEERAIVKRALSQAAAQPREAASRVPPPFAVSRRPSFQPQTFEIASGR